MMTTHDDTNYNVNHMDDFEFEPEAFKRVHHQRLQRRVAPAHGSDWRGHVLDEPPLPPQPLTPRDPLHEEPPAVAADDHQIPWQIGDGIGEAQHREPVAMSDDIK